MMIIYSYSQGTATRHRLATIIYKGGNIMSHEELFILDFIYSIEQHEEIADSIDEYIYDVDVYRYCDGITEEDLKTYEGYYFE